MTEYAIISLDDVQKTPGKSGTPRAVLTDILNLQQTRSSVWYLSPGQQTTFHTHAKQEELYFQIQGPGQMRIHDDLIDVPERSVIKMPPGTPRCLLNNSKKEHIWLVIGSPPVKNDGRPVIN